VHSWCQLIVTSRVADQRVTARTATLHRVLAEGMLAACSSSVKRDLSSQALSATSRMTKARYFLQTEPLQSTLPPYHLQKHQDALHGGLAGTLS